MRIPLKSFRKTCLLSVVSAPVLAFAIVSNADAGPLERVPEDGTLQQAIGRVSNRGVIDIAAGTYAAPANGFRIRNKSVTLRARNGAEVVLDGQGTAPIFEVENRGVGTGEAVAFEGITFRNGFSTSITSAGGVTVDGAQAVFVSCRFDANVASGSQNRGGAVQARNGSSVRVVHSRFTDNTAGQWGAGIFAIEGSRVRVLWSEFIGNRTDLPNHGPVPAGGAIYVLDAEAHVRNSYFENNASGWVGGALYALGTFRNPAGVPAALLTVENSTFIGNRALPDDCCSVPGPPAGGAIHVEDQASVFVRNSRFFENETNWGGAISSYRALIEVSDSVFRGNRAMPYEGVVGAGGTFNVSSSDFPDGTTDFGAVNRRPGSLTVRDSLIEGRFGSTGLGGQQGGCIFGEGDTNSLNGANGMPQDGTAEDNRVKIDLDDVVLADCDVETSAEGTGLGGAIMVNTADLSLDDSIVYDSEALVGSASGGAIFSFNDSLVRARGTAFARNAAEQRGGGIMMNGGRVELSDCFFLENDVTPSEAEPVQRSPGASLAFVPSNNLDVTGFVENSVFTGDLGIPIVDVDSATGPTFNEVVYNGNRIHSPTFGDQVYKNQAVGFGGLTVNELNNLVINRPGGGTTVKSEVDNTFLGSAPRDGRLVGVPSHVLATTTPGDGAASTAFLGYAWSGSSSSINGVALGDKVGFEEVDDAGNYAQRVSGQSFASVAVGEEDCSGGGTLCLNGERFFVEVDFRDFGENVGDASVVPGLSSDSGLYFFFSEDNWEMLVKVLNGCSITDHFWVFAAATTNVEYTLRVTDKRTGMTKSYFNPLNNAAAAITDTEALAVCDAKAAPEEAPALSLAGRIQPRPAAPELASWEPAGQEHLSPDPDAASEISEKQGNCTDSSTELCLNRGRFRVGIEWRDFENRRGTAQVGPLRSDDSGLYFFFTEDNLEMLVKVLTGCSITNHFWVFAAATTNVEYTLTVTDTETGTVKRYFNPLGNAAAAITDTEAFATCP